MRPLTEALLRANAEGLTQKGWKPDEQRRCFRKADALLDYIGKIKPSEYRRVGWRTLLNEQRVEGLRYRLEKDMPSAQMRLRSLEALSNLLSIGEEMLIKAAWLFTNCTALFKAKYASSPQAFCKEIHGFFVKGRFVPEYSFPAFKTGENPAVSRDDAFLDKCIDMYNDSLFETSEFQDWLNQPARKRYPYFQWTQKSKAGRRFSNENLALQYVIGQLEKKDEIKLKVDKALAHQLLQKKQKTK